MDSCFVRKERDEGDEPRKCGFLWHHGNYNGGPRRCPFKVLILARVDLVRFSLNEHVR